jgi:hypothetical protein
MKENGKLTVSAASEVPPFPPFPRLHGSCRVNTVPQPKPRLLYMPATIDRSRGILEPRSKDDYRKILSKKSRLIFAQISEVHFPGYTVDCGLLWV